MTKEERKIYKRNWARKRMLDPKYKLLHNKRSKECMRKLLRDPEYRAKVNKRQQERMGKLLCDPKQREKIYKRKSELRKKQMLDTAYKNKVYKQNNESYRLRMLNPEYRAKLNKSVQEKFNGLPNEHPRKIAASQRTRLRGWIKTGIHQSAGGGKPCSAIRDCGCSVPDLIKHIESQFHSGMTWKNWGPKGWHIDHIKPFRACKNSAKRAELIKFIHYTNLQPLWSEEHKKKTAEEHRLYPHRRNAA